MDKLINTIRQYFDTGSYDSEEAVRTQICYPILHELGWDTRSPVHVVPEYKVDNLKVDIALCHSPREPVIFIEVKAPGKCSPQGQNQAFKYAAGQGGIPMIIFTDGNEWHFYNSYGTGGYESRKVKNIRLTKDNSNDCVKYFRRYLQYEEVETEQVFENLRRDYEQARSADKAKSKIPEAWDLLVNASDEMLVEIIIDQVKKTSDGKHSPKKEDVAEFLKGLKPVNQSEKQTTMGSGNISKQETRPGSKAEKIVHRYKINGQIHNGRNGKDVYMKVLDYVLTEYGRFEELKNQKFNKMKSRALGTGYHTSEEEGQIPKEREHKTKLEQSKIWVNTNLSAENMSARLIKVGEFYNRVEHRKILDKWDSGAEVEFDIPTRSSSSL